MHDLLRMSLERERRHESGEKAATYNSNTTNVKNTEYTSKL